MGTVETVRGPVEASELGRTLAHEHILIIEPEALQNWGHVYGPCYWDEEVRVADAIARLRELRETGIRTIIDPTAPGLGRHIPRIQRINESVDLNSSSRAASMRSWRCRISSPTETSTRSRSCSCANSARGSTTRA